MPLPDRPDLPEMLAAEPPRAGAFIVSVYGDVVLPRGGALWMGSLIEVCAAQGISESLVRTAVSRLVGAGQLEGERIGRRSYYRLTPSAAQEYARAGTLFYGVQPEAGGWHVALGALPDPLPQPWARLGAEAALAPDWAEAALPGAVILAARTVAPVAHLPGFAARHWPLAEAAAAYRRVLAGFDGLPATPRDGAGALALRLRLIHLYRQAVLRDPRLPADAVPADWPGTAARLLFARSYLALAAAADAHIGARLRDSGGLLPAETGTTRQRLDALGVVSGLQATGTA